MTSFVFFSIRVRRRTSSSRPRSAIANSSRGSSTRTRGQSGIASGDCRSSRPSGYNGRGGTIYQWTLAFNSYAHQIALLKGHPDVFDLLWARSDDTTRLLVSCVLARRDDAEAIAARHPGIVASLPAEDLELLPTLLLGDEHEL